MPFSDSYDLLTVAHNCVMPYDAGAPETSRQQKPWWCIDNVCHLCWLAWHIFGVFGEEDVSNCNWKNQV